MKLARDLACTDACLCLLPPVSPSHCQLKTLLQTEFRTLEDFRKRQGWQAHSSKPGKQGHSGSHGHHKKHHDEKSRLGGKGGGSEPSNGTGEELSSSPVVQASA